MQITKILMATLLFGTAPANVVNAQFTYQRLNGFPSTEEGIEKGVSACYAGSINDYLVMAGGCNFPNDPLGANSQKRYYKGIYIAKSSDSNALHWEKAGELPYSLAYGFAVNYKDHLIVVGGMDSAGSKKEVYSISLQEGKATIDTLPSLPHAIDNMAGIKFKRHLYIIGGNIDGKASNKMFCLDLEHPSAGWEELPAFPGMARVQPIAISISADEFGVYGGFTPKGKDGQADIALDGVVYDVKAKNWSSIEGPKVHEEPVFLGGGAAANVYTGYAIVTGGVNKDVFLGALRHPQPDYILHPEEWYRFNPHTFLVVNGHWKTILTDKVSARAGAAMVFDERSGIYVIGGEKKPRIRTNEIIRLAQKAKTDELSRTE